MNESESDQNKESDDPGIIKRLEYVQQPYEQALSNGLSPSMRWLLGATAAFFAGFMFFMAGETQAPKVAYIFASFCAAIAVACFTQGKARVIACRWIGGLVFITGICYLGKEIIEGTYGLKGALMFLLIFGLPGAYYAWKGRFMNSVK